jgi:hypothetical protein
MRRALLIALVLAGCSRQRNAVTLPGAGVGPIAPAIAIFGSSADQLAGTPAHAFNFAYQRELWITVSVPMLSGPAKLSLSFVNPRSEPFVEDHALYSSDASMRTVADPAGGHALDVITARTVPGGFALDREIPIAGTVFQRAGSDGDWQLSATVDGNNDPPPVIMTVTSAR